LVRKLKMEAAGYSGPSVTFKKNAGYFKPKYYDP
jgi:hypothetical protein